MTHIGPLNGLPIACTLTASAGKAQVEKWKKFGEHYALDIKRADTHTRLTIHSGSATPVT